MVADPVWRGELSPPRRSGQAYQKVSTALTPLMRRRRERQSELEKMLAMCLRTAPWDTTRAAATAVFDRPGYVPVPTAYGEAANRAEEG